MDPFAARPKNRGEGRQRAVRSQPQGDQETRDDQEATCSELGIHGSIDGGPYTRLEIEDPRGRTIFTLVAAGRLAKQGVTQLFFESAEPNFAELDPELFFRRFPEGEYEIEASRNGQEVEATVELSHVLAAPPSGIEINGLEAAEDCDAVPLPSVSEPVTIDWEPVTDSHPDVGDPGDGSVEIDRYQFFVEQGDVKFAVDLPPTVTEFQVPTEITAAGAIVRPGRRAGGARTPRPALGRPPGMSTRMPTKTILGG